MDDLISRQAAIDVLARFLSNREGGNAVWWKPVAESVIDILPSAQPERKAGKWIEVDDYYNRISGRCSICGWEALLYETDVVGMNFCPNCGARMEETE